MLSDAEAMRVMADNYRRLAERQTDAKESEKYLAYAGVYDELAISRERGQLFGPSAPEKLD